MSAHLTLAHYLRYHLGLTGTKVTCGQAGCGACVVTAEILEPTTGQWVVKSVNSVKNFVLEMSLTINLLFISMAKAISLQAADRGQYY